MTTVCSLEGVVSALKICLDRGSFLSRNMSFIIQILRELLLLIGFMYQASYTSISEIESKSYKPLFLKVCSHKTAGIPAIVYIYAVLIQIPNLRKTKQKYKDNLSYLDAATLTDVFPCFFLGCKANARV